MKICLWRYLENTKHYPGYHLSADSEGCTYLCERINDQWDRSSFSLVEPDSAVLSVPNNQGGRAGIYAFTKLSIETNGAEGERFSMEEHTSTLVLQISPRQTNELLKAIDAMKRGEGDYALKGRHNGSLWFWWQTG